MDVNTNNGNSVPAHDDAKIDYKIPKECKAGVVVNEGPNFSVRVEMVPVPDPAPDEVLIRLNVTGICFSDIHFMAGDLDLPAMSEFGVRSPGHEGAGVVVKIGANVNNWKVGQRAGLKPVWSTCGNCTLCWSGKEAHCPHSIHTGIMRAGSYQVCHDVDLPLSQSHVALPDRSMHAVSELIGKAIRRIARSIHCSNTGWRE